MVKKLGFGRISGLETSLAIQYWDLYVLSNEKTTTIADV
jgi:hypothetical protein